MKTQTIKVEGLPEGWKAVDFRWPKKDVDYVFDGIGVKLFLGKEDHAMLIVEKIQPRRIVLESSTEIRKAVFGDWLYNNGIIEQWRSQKESQSTYRIWREVKETDISLTKDEPKLSLSVAELKDACSRIWPDYLVAKVNEFIKENS